MYLYTYYTKASVAITDVIIYNVEIYIYFDRKACICEICDIYSFKETIKNGGIKL